MKYYIAKVSFNEELETGATKVIKEQHVIDALSFIEAETRIFEIMELQKAHDYTLSSISTQLIADALGVSDGEHYYMVKVVMVLENEIRGTKKRIPNSYLVKVNSCAEAIGMVEDNIKEWLIPYEIEAVKLTGITEVHIKNEKI